MSNERREDETSTEHALRLLREDWTAEIRQMHMAEVRRRMAAEEKLRRVSLAINDDFMCGGTRPLYLAGQLREILRDR